MPDCANNAAESTNIFIYSSLSGYREPDDELGMPGSAFTLDSALMLLNEALRNSKAQTRATLSARNKRVEHAL